MIPEKDKRYLLRYEFDGKTYEDVGTFVEVVSPLYSEDNCVEYKFKVVGGHILLKENEIIRIIGTTQQALVERK